MGTLTNQYVSQSYQGLLKLDDSTTGVTGTLQHVQDGVGNNLPIQVSTSSVVITGSFSGDGSGLTGITSTLPSGTVSGSQQIVDLGFATTGSNTFVGNEVISGSLDVTNGITGSLQGIASNAISSSHAINADTASFLLGTIASASFAEYAVTASIANDLIVRGKCSNVGGLTKGTIVRINGADGDNPTFDSASWINDANSANTLGMLTDNVAHNDFANVVVQGKVIGINTSGMTAGDLLFLSSSGQYTTSSVPAPYHEVRLGQVLRANTNNGSVYISIDNGYEISELHDVDIQSVAVGDVLTYVSGAYGQWVNKSGTELGYATTGSNTFVGNQNITGALLQSSSLPNEITRVQIANSNKAFFGDANTLLTLVGDATGKFDFYADGGNYDTFNIEVAQNGGTTFSDYNGSTYPSWLKIPTNTGANPAPQFQRGLGVTGSLYVSGSAATDVTVDGKMLVFSTSGAGNAAQIQVSGSYAGGGVSTVTAGSVSASSGSFNGVVSKSAINHVDSTGAPTTNKYLGFSANPSLIGAPSVTGVTVPSILAMNDSSQPEAIINFEHRGAYTDGRMTVLKPMVLNAGATGSFYGDGSGLTGVTAAPADNVATTGSNVFIGDQTITGSLLMSGSADYDVDVTGRIRITGPSTGNTPRLLVSSSVNNTIVASNFTQIRQPGNNTIALNNGFGGYVGINKESDSTEIGLAVDGATFTSNWSNGPILYVNNDSGDNYFAAFGFQDKTNYTDGRITALKPLVLNSGATGSFYGDGSGLTGITAAPPDNVATTGSNVFIGDQVITGSILQSGSLPNELTRVQIANSNKAFYGDANTLLTLVGDSVGKLDFYADGGNYDTFNVTVTQNGGTAFSDFNGSTYPNWLVIPTNTGANPAPQFKRGLAITGSLNINGSLIASGSGGIGFSPNTNNAIFGSLGMIDAPMAFSRSVSDNYRILMTYTEGIGLGLRNGNIVIGRESSDAFLNNLDNAGNFMFGQYGGQQFQSGSSNIFINTGGHSFVSGSENIFLQRSCGTLETGSYNVIVGSYDRGNTEENNFLSLGSTTHAYIEGTDNNLVHIKDDLTVSGSINTTMPTVDITVNTTGSIDLSLGNSFYVTDDGNPAGGHLIFTNHKDGQQVSVLINTATSSQTLTLQGAIQIANNSNSVFLPDTGYSLLQGVCRGGVFYGSLSIS